MNKTSIEWTDFTSNPLKYRNAAGKVVWGCVHASPGCQHCYAETLAKRYDRGGPFNVPITNSLIPFLDHVEVRRMLTYKPAAGKRCFVGDMTDVFGEWVPDRLLDELFVRMAQRPDVTFQLLTKRAARLMHYSVGLFKLTPTARADRWADSILANANLRFTGEYVNRSGVTWPLPNVWLGVSVEDQVRADERIALLLQTPAQLRFLSVEPILAATNLRLTEGFCRACKQYTSGSIDGHSLNPASACFAGEMAISDGIDLVIVGGESGSGARICNVDWIGSIVTECASAGVPVFVKQLGSKPLMWDRATPTGNFRTNPETGRREFEVNQPSLKSRKGSDPAEWPEDLRVREFPQSGAFS